MLCCDFLIMIVVVIGIVMIGGWVMVYLLIEVGVNVFMFEDIVFLDEMVEVILFWIDMFGVKDVGVGVFMMLYVSDCYMFEDQQGFCDGMVNLKVVVVEQGMDFMQMILDVCMVLLDGIVCEVCVVIVEGVVKVKVEGWVVKNVDMYWFMLLYQFVLFGFFILEIGVIEVLCYELVFGEYIGDLDYDGEFVWVI